MPAREQPPPSWCGTLCPASRTAVRITVLLLQGQEELAACLAAAVVPLVANATEILAV